MRISDWSSDVCSSDLSDNNLSITTRGISTNGYQAGLQSTTTVYLDELPLTTIGNSVTLDPNLYDVERVEFLRGPQGTLFGSGSLSGALRILTTSPDLPGFDASGQIGRAHVLTPVTNAPHVCR